MVLVLGGIVPLRAGCALAIDRDHSHRRVGAEPRRTDAIEAVRRVGDRVADPLAEEDRGGGGIGRRADQPAGARGARGAWWALRTSRTLWVRRTGRATRPRIWPPLRSARDGNE